MTRFSADITNVAAHSSRRILTTDPIQTAVVSASLCALFFFHPAALSFVGRAYYSMIGLNDVLAPARVNILLQPAMIIGLVLLVWRRSHRAATLPFSGTKYGLLFGLGLIFSGATLGFLANASTQLVDTTYWSGFVAGILLFIALSRLTLEERDIDRLFLALAVGSLIPLVAGWYAFYSVSGFPDYSTAISAQGDRTTFALYEQATFGNRGNTVGLLVLVGPPMLYLALDAMRPPGFRLVWLTALCFIALNLLILQQRAAFLVLSVAGVLVLRFKLGWRGGYVLSLLLLLGTGYSLQTYVPDTAEKLYGRFAPALTGNAAEDASVDARLDAMKEGMALASENMPFGLGPGAAITKHSQGSAHQFNIDQAMEGGILGLVGSILTCLALAVFFVRTITIGDKTAINRRRFVMTIGPAMYLLNGVVANGPTASGYINLWVVLFLALLALAPAISRTEVSRISRPPATRSAAFRRGVLASR